MKKQKWYRSILVLGIAVVGVVLPAYAQTTDERLDLLDQQIKILQHKLEINHETTEDKRNSFPTLDSGNDGFVLNSADDNLQVRFQGYVQTDFRFFYDDQKVPLTDTFLIRRARPIFSATLYKYFDLYINPDFGLGTIVLKDSYLDVHPTQAFRIRVGKFKEPVGLEKLQADVNNKFIEVALPSDLVPNRDVGAQLYGDLFHGILSYQVGVFNGVVDGGSTDTDNNDSKDFVERIFTIPFKNSSSDWVNGLGIGIAASEGNELTALPTFNTGGQNTFFAYLSTVTANGSHTRISPQLYYYKGSFGLISEYVASTQDIQKGKVLSTVSQTSWQTAVSYLITGEKSSYNGVYPVSPFDFKKNQWGAFELAARYSELDIDSDSFDRGLADLNVSARRAQEYVVGLNWYLNRSVKYAINYGHTYFSGGAKGGLDREDEQLIFTRFQLAF